VSRQYRTDELFFPDKLRPTARAEETPPNPDGRPVDTGAPLRVRDAQTLAEAKARARALRDKARARDRGDDRTDDRATLVEFADDLDEAKARARKLAEAHGSRS